MQHLFSKINFSGCKFIPNLKDIPHKVKDHTMSYIGDVYDQYFARKRMVEQIFEHSEGLQMTYIFDQYVVKILANTEGLQMLRSLENRSYNVSRSTSEAITKGPMLSPLGPNATVGTNIAVSDRGAPVSSIGGLNGDNRNLADSKPMNIDEAVEKSKIWKLAEINEPSQCSSLKLFDPMLSAKVARLIYTNTGSAILSLACNAIHKLWKWQKNDRNVTGKATTSVPPQLWQPSSGILMTNEVGDSNSEDAIHCFALSKNDSYVMSASGGKISLFNMMTFKTMTAFMPPPPAATFLAFHPQDNNIIAIGMDDSSIHIYNVRIDEVKTKLRGHQKRITGLAFSNVLKCLVSSGADAQLCVWETDGWDRQVSKSLQIPSGRVLGSFCETKVQFHNDQNHFLVVHESQLAIYETSKLDCLKQWVSGGINITHATYSCDGELIYASFMDGSVAVFNSALRLRARINPTAYLNSPPSSSVYPVVVAANPIEKNQFAIGLTDGSIQVIEPLESEGKWGTDPPPESNGASSSVKVATSSAQPPSSNPTADQQSR